MTALLSLLAAAAYGLSDFNGGVQSKRINAWTIAFCGQLAGCTVTLTAALFVAGRPDGSDLLWAAAAGIGNGIGTAFFYRGLASGRMGVVAPVSGVGAAALPVVVGVAIGERPSLLVWVGIVVALPAIWLVSREPVSSTPARGGLASSGLVDGALAGLGFGFLFVALSRVGDHAGLFPLALNQAVAGLAIVAVALAFRQPWLPRERRAGLAAISGVLGASATGLFMVASRGGHLSIAAVVISLYPAFTVLLAALVLRERVHAAQGAGLALCALSVALVAAG